MILPPLPSPKKRGAGGSTSPDLRGRAGLDFPTCGTSYAGVAATLA